MLTGEQIAFAKKLKSLVDISAYKNGNNASNFELKTYHFVTGYADEFLSDTEDRREFFAAFAFGK